MENFKRKNFSSKEKLIEAGKKTVKFVKKNPTVPLSAAALGVSITNLGVNTSRQKEAKEYQEKHLKALENQSNVISRNTKALEEYNRNASHPNIQIVAPTPPKKRFRFFSSKNEKNFSIKSDIATGAQIGAGIGAGASFFLPKKLGTKYITKKPTIPENIGGYEVAGEVMKSLFRENYNSTPQWQRQIALTVGGALIGAALGALCGTIKKIDNKISRRTVTSDRLMSDIIANLKKSGFKEGRNFTRDPKLANLLECKVCIAVSRSNGDLRILVNYIDDPKLKNLTTTIAKNTPNTGIRTQVASNKYNEITISTISDSSADATLVSRIAEQYIHSGFPVYLVEVG